MENFEREVMETQAEEIAARISKCYHAKGIDFKIPEKGIMCFDDYFVFKVKFLANTRKEQIKRYANDAKLFLKIPIFEIIEKNEEIFILVRNEMPRNYQLFQIMESPIYMEAKKQMGIAHPVGINFMGIPVVADLEKYPHALVCGTKRSGKSVALKSLVVSILRSYSPEQVNFLIFDGANDLMQFEGIPNLSYPIIQDFETFYAAIHILYEEMERRVKLKNTGEFSKIPSIICIMDEFSSFISGTTEKQKSEETEKVIMELLRRGRHSKIHLVLAVHNPTKRNTRIDLCDIPVKLVFQVAGMHNSVAALGERGAEKLKGRGDLLFEREGKKSHLQGAFISPAKVDKFLDSYRKRWRLFILFSSGDAGFHITEEEMENRKDDGKFLKPLENERKTQNGVERQLAEIILWTLGKDSVSCNMLSENFGIGWSRANRYIRQLHEMGIVGDLDAKLPRKVLILTMEDVPDNVKKFLKKNGIGEERINESLTM